MFRSYCVRPSGDMVEMSDDLWTITGSPLLTQNTRVIVQCVCNGPLRQYYKNFILYQPSACGATWRQRAPWNRFKQIVISACSFSSSIDALSYRLVNYNITRKLVCVCVWEHYFKFWRMLRPYRFIVVYAPVCSRREKSSSSSSLKTNPLSVNHFITNVKNSFENHPSLP